MATREWVKAAIKGLAGKNSEEVSRTVIDAMDSVRERIDFAISALERSCTVHPRTCSRMS